MKFNLDFTLKAFQCGTFILILFASGCQTLNSEKHQSTQEKVEEETQSVDLQKQEEVFDEKEEQREIDEEKDPKTKDYLETELFFKKNRHKYELLNSDKLEFFIKGNPNYTCWENPSNFAKLCYPKDWPVVFKNELIQKNNHKYDPEDNWKSILTFKKWPNQNEPVSIEYYTYLVDYEHLYISLESKINHNMNESNSIAFHRTVLIQENGQIVVESLDGEMFEKTTIWEMDKDGYLFEIKQDYHQVLLNSYATKDFDLYQYQFGDKIIAKIKKGARVTVLLSFMRSSINEYGNKIDVYDFLVSNEFGIVGWIRDVPTDSCIWASLTDNKKPIFDICYHGS